MNYYFYCLASPKPDGKQFYGSPLRVRAFFTNLSNVSVKEQGGRRSFGSDGKSQTKAELMKCTSSTSTEYKRSCYILLYHDCPASVKREIFSEVLGDNA